MQIIFWLFVALAVGIGGHEVKGIIRTGSFWQEGGRKE